MTLNDILPELHNIYFFKYNHNDNPYSKISFLKTQYTYRFIYIASGALDVCINGVIENVKQGDLLYILPGDFYRLIPDKCDFSVYSIFFDISGNHKDFEIPNKGCIFENEYKRELCLKKAVFKDAPLLNKSGISHNIFCENIIEKIIYADKCDNFYNFVVSSHLRSIIASVLTTDTNVKYEKNTISDKIVEYIRTNYDKDISAKSISAEFSYHPNYINKLIKQKTGKSLSNFIRHTKISYALGLLYENDITLSEISATLGYYDYSHFYKAFVAETGFAPTEYKRKN
jgi:AraC-like DNA-binding protein